MYVCMYVCMIVHVCVHVCANVHVKSTEVNFRGYLILCEGGIGFEGYNRSRIAAAIYVPRQKQ